MKNINTTDSIDSFSINELNEFINLYKLNLPKSYQEFILKNNGGYPEENVFYLKKIDQEFEIHFFYSINLKYKDKNILDRLDDLVTSNQIIDNYQIEEKELPSFLYPFGQNSGGSTYCISTKKSDLGFIYLHYWDGSGQQYICDSFEDFINGLK